MRGRRRALRDIFSLDDVFLYIREKCEDIFGERKRDFFSRDGLTMTILFYALKLFALSVTIRACFYLLLLLLLLLLLRRRRRRHQIRLKANSTHRRTPPE